MSELQKMRRLLILGLLKQVTKNALMTRYRVDIAHHYLTEEEAMEGKKTVMQGHYDTVLFTTTISPKFREFIIEKLKNRPDFSDIVIGVVTDTPSYDSWLGIPPGASAETIAERFGFEIQGNPAQVIVVTNTKGGVGKSFVASNLAAVLGKDGLGLNVALLEDDWTTRSVKDLMGVKDTEKMSANLVADIEQNRGVVTADLLREYLIMSYGAHCLIGPPNIITRFEVHPEMAKEIIAVMGHEMGFDVIIVDAPPDFLGTSSFSLSLLNDTENAPTPPLILVPVVPETTILRSANDTLQILQHMKHPRERIWPVVNRLKAEHNPEMLRGRRILWREPAAIIPYCPDAQFVGDRLRPLVAEKPGGWLARFWRKQILDVADVFHVREAYMGLGKKVLAYIEEQRDESK